MPAELAKYGIAFFAVAGLIYIIGRWIERRDEINLDAGGGRLGDVHERNCCPALDLNLKRMRRTC